MTTNEWIAMLAKLTAPTDPVHAAKALGAYLPLLNDMPPQTWCVASLEHVAGQAKRVPTYGELRGWLREWLGCNLPITARLPPPERAAAPRREPTQEEHAYVRGLVHNFVSERAEPVRGGVTGTASHLSPGQLIAAYEAAGTDAAKARAQFLRAQIEQETQP